MSFDAIYNAINSPAVTVESATFKMFLSLVAGGLVGFNREQQKQQAGFRTHILICLGATLLMILSIYIPQKFFDLKSGDPGRIAAQVVSGIGFLGAGAIIKLGNNIKGLTTAASIWLIAAIGMSIGAGLYVISFITLGFALFTLVILDKFEHRWFPQFLTKTILIVADEKDFPDSEIKKILKRFHIQITDYNINVKKGKNVLVEIGIGVKIPEHADLSKLINDFNAVHAIRVIQIA